MDVRIYSIKELSVQIKQMFDSNAEFRNITIRGELSNFKHHVSSGHFYFTLKEDDAAIDGVMFSSKARNVKFQPRDGMKIVINGYISTYPARGNYQVYAQTMKEDGKGDIYERYEKLKADLEKKGYFNDLHKKPIPKYPKAIGVLTSDTGAAVRDIINTVERRFPLTELYIYPTLVQGIGAKESISENIKRANSEGLVDVLIVGRGGGSIEDLWAFNEEIVAEAIYHSKLPIISAVGHETDFTIADFVADIRAATPTAAAELAVPDKKQLQLQLKNVDKLLSTKLDNKVNNLAQKLKYFSNSYVFENPERIINKKQQQLDSLTHRLEKLSPLEKLKVQEVKLNHLKESLEKNSSNVVTKFEQHYLRMIQKLELTSPLTIMKKGYSIAKKADKIIRSINDVTEGEVVTIQVNDGEIDSKVINRRG